MRGELYLVLTTILAALGWGASKMVVLDVPGELFIGTRFLLASLILLPFCWKRVIKLSKKHLLALSGMGLIMSACLQAWVAAVSITSSLAEGAFIMSLAMLIAPMTAWALFRNRPSKAFWISLPIAILGMMLLTLTNGWTMEVSQLVFLLSSVLASLHFVLNKRILTGSGITPLTSICVQLFVVGVSGLLYTSTQTLPDFEISKTTIFWFTVSTLVATSIRYLTQTLGQFSVKIETASLIMILEPVFTLILSMTWLGESLEMQKLLGCGVIVLSLVTYIRLSNRIK
ncbi:DMT family transporter [Vibrio maerlii]|uniref:DMT family transporter n=1 Tax=Vibrio maerlii TaxID=2231648 RepID=UPI000E3D01EE|nr:DMT family transporter [Vibrio maerlii]